MVRTTRRQAGHRNSDVRRGSHEGATGAPSRLPRDDFSMTGAIAPPAGAVSGLILKATPPRAPRNLLVRHRIASDDPQFRDRPLIVVQAPAGFGKTSLLAQWRRELLSRGAVVAWLAGQAGDAP